MIDLLAIAATLFAAVFLIPQIIRIVRYRDLAGVSVTWASFGFITNISWVIYLAEARLWMALMPPSFGVLGYGITLWAAATRCEHRAWARASLFYVVVLLAAVSIGGAAGVGLILTAAPLFQITPGLVAAYRTKRPTGIAPTTWALLAAIGLTRGGYGWLVDDMALLGYGLVTCVGSLLILTRWFATQPRVRMQLAI